MKIKNSQPPNLSMDHEMNFCSNDIFKKLIIYINQHFTELGTPFLNVFE